MNGGEWSITHQDIPQVARAEYVCCSNDTCQSCLVHEADSYIQPFADISTRRTHDCVTVLLDAQEKHGNVFADGQRCPPIHIRAHPDGECITGLVDRRRRAE